ncbi:hypothetical protein [Nostoc sp. NMS8]|uniref:hypothetical protein n=1 Tax=Nostoc sp. NMS8 TaxID=2815392 RepID=UPI0025DE3452|nr:hypothetical protein [Nostoc sp. NMS8]MBN3957921.1 hypothetical protein [Nostoc sp. NMS8]
MRYYYKLVGHTPVAVNSLSEWRDYLHSVQDSGQHLVAETIVGDAKVSTSFSGFDLTFGDPPLLFETMVLGGPHHGRMQRYSTWEQALTGHDRTVVEVMTTSPPDK